MNDVGQLIDRERDCGTLLSQFTDSKGANGSISRRLAHSQKGKEKGRKPRNLVTFHSIFDFKSIGIVFQPSSHFFDLVRAIS